MNHLVRVWDLPTRIFHWALALLVVVSVVTANVGGNAMVWHMRCGLAILSLLMFRLVWGLVGGHWSRFQSFLYAPSTLWAYLRGRVAEPAGHSPLGALSVFGLLLVLAAQALAGLFSDDEIAFAGPLARLASSDTVAQATGWHTGPGKFLLIALILLHILAIVFYTRVRRKSLVGPMVTGDKQLPQNAPASRDDARTRLLALVVWLACAGAVAGTAKWLG